GRHLQLRSHELCTAVALAGVDAAYPVQALRRLGAARADLQCRAAGEYADGDDPGRVESTQSHLRACGGGAGATWVWSGVAAARLDAPERVRKRRATRALGRHSRGHGTCGGADLAEAPARSTSGSPCRVGRHAGTTASRAVLAANGAPAE